MALPSCFFLTHSRPRSHKLTGPGTSSSFSSTHKQTPSPPSSSSVPSGPATSATSTLPSSIPKPPTSNSASTPPAPPRQSTSTCRSSRQPSRCTRSRRGCGSGATRRCTTTRWSVAPLLRQRTADAEREQPRYPKVDYYSRPGPFPAAVPAAVGLSVLFYALFGVDQYADWFRDQINMIFGVYMLPAATVFAALMVSSLPRLLPMMWEKMTADTHSISLSSLYTSTCACRSTEYQGLYR